jgi:nucleoside-diphosphate-sugar epimerase
MFKIAVIGASGLLGRALVDELTQQADWQVVATAFSRPTPDTVSLIFVTHRRSSNLSNAKHRTRW